MPRRVIDRGVAHVLIDSPGTVILNAESNETVQRTHELIQTDANAVCLTAPGSFLWSPVTATNSDPETKKGDRANQSLHIHLPEGRTHCARSTLANAFGISCGAQRRQLHAVVRPLSRLVAISGVEECDVRITGVDSC